MLKILDEILHAYESKRLESLCLGVDIFEKRMLAERYKRHKTVFQHCVDKLRNVGDSDTLNSFLYKLRSF